MCIYIRRGLRFIYNQCTSLYIAQRCAHLGEGVGRTTTARLRVVVWVRAVHGCACPPNTKLWKLDIVYCILVESWQTTVRSSTGGRPPIYGTPVERGSWSCKIRMYNKRLIIIIIAEFDLLMLYC